MSRAPRILVIADDLTGAAELAGILAEAGLPTRILRGGVPAHVAETSLVIDTDSRHASADQAAAKIRSALKGLPLDTFALIYKKTDSILRGNIAAEIAAVESLTGRPRTLLLPQNPSKGRIIRNGEYFISETPLHETDFRFDPEHPRTSASIAALLAPATVMVLATGAALPSEGLAVANAASLDQLTQWAGTLPPGTLPAGGADFFKALVQKVLGGRSSPDPAALVQQIDPTSPGETPPKLVLLGSASGYSRATAQQWLRDRLPIFPLPDDFTAPPSHASSEAWQSDIRAALLTRRLAILAITAPINSGRAAHYRQSFATVLQQLLAAPELSRAPLQLFIEGGATAAAALDALGWTELAVLASLAPGVITLRPVAAPDIALTIKPGSYPWPAGFPA
jgi:uncharacterized protein YgbK (DUF1537 family)